MEFALPVIHVILLAHKLYRVAQRQRHVTAASDGFFAVAHSRRRFSSPVRPHLRQKVAGKAAEAGVGRKASEMGLQSGVIFKVGEDVLVVAVFVIQPEQDFLLFVRRTNHIPNDQTSARAGLAIF